MKFPRVVANATRKESGAAPLAAAAVGAFAAGLAVSVAAGAFSLQPATSPRTTSTVRPVHRSTGLPVPRLFRPTILWNPLGDFECIGKVDLLEHAVGQRDAVQLPERVI